MSSVDTTATDAPTALSDELQRWAEAWQVPPAYAELVTRFVANSFELSSRPDLMLAHLIHGNLRSATAIDGAPPEDMPVLTAPDLRIEREGIAHALPHDIPDEAAEFHELVRARRSAPYFDAGALELETLAALLGTALGARELTYAYNRRDVPSRMFPSAGGLQPLDAYVIVNRVAGLDSGIYFYNPVRHELVQHELGEFRTRVVDAVIQTDWMFHAPVVVALVGNMERVAWKYGTRGYRYLNVDTGVATMNLYLAAVSLGLRGNAVAAFDDDAFNALLRLDGVGEFTNLLFATGRPPFESRRRA